MAGNVTIGVQADPAGEPEWGDFARRVEEAGFDRLMVADHPGSGSAPFVALAAAAAVTNRLELGSYVARRVAWPGTDASAVVDLLVRSDAGVRVRDFLAAHADAALLTLAHLDAEVLSALARLHCADVLDEQEVEALLDRLGQLPVQRLPITAELLAAGWAMRDNVAARDALYVAAAQAAAARLVTTDGRLARSVPDLAADPG